jgi:hypothetical protein
MIPLILYFFIYIWKGEFTYPVMERVIFGLGEAAFLAVFYLFKYDSSDLLSYDLDFFLLGFIILIDLILYFARGISLGVYGTVSKDIAEVNPEPNSNSRSPMAVEKRANKYDSPSIQ